MRTAIPVRHQDVVRGPEPFTKAPKWEDPLEAASGRRAAAARRRWLEALRSLAAGLPERATRNAVAARDINRVVAVLSTGRFEVMVRQAAEPFGEEFTAAAGREAARLALVFDRADTAGEAWAARRAAELVVEISEDTRGAIRKIARKAFADGLAPADIAPRIRGIIGLHSRWARAVYRYQQRLEARGLNAARVAERTSRYYQRLLRVRSENIARTEVMRAANAGKMATWREASDQGLFVRAEATKEWLSAPDERTCFICDLLDGEVVGIDELFGTGDDAPPAHPSCRCTSILRIGERVL